MNTLDSLYDFAALMSTSSAMTLVPVSNDSNEFAQDTQTSKACSVPTAPGQPCQMPHHLQQTDGSMQPLPQTENPIATFPRAHIDSGGQCPIDWVPAPPFSQEISMQGQYPLISEHSRLPAYEAPVVDCCTLLCSHHPSQRCDCRYSLPPSRRHQEGSMVPSFREDQHVLLGQSGPELQQFQQLPTDVLTREGHILGQMLPPHSFCTEDSYDPITPHSAALQYKAFLDIGMDTRCQGAWSC